MAMADDFWILRPFNTLFWLVFGFFLLLLAVASLLLRGKSEKTKQTVLVTTCIVTLIGFFFYKYSLSLDSITMFSGEITAASTGGENCHCTSATSI